MMWYFYYPKRFSFSPRDYDTEEDVGLGGGEGSLVVLARALARAGQTVVVLNCCSHPGIYDGVTWKMAWELETMPAPDVFVSVRFQEALAPTITAPYRLYWMLDDRWKGAAQFLHTYGHTGGIVVTASHTMRDILLAHVSPAYAPAVQVIPLPVEPRACVPLRERELACLYCSVPNRGLDSLLSWWPQVVQAVPQVHLWVTGGYQLWGYSQEEAEDRTQQLLGAHYQSVPNVTFFGVVPRERLRHMQAHCACMVYPCRFPEMFCLAAAECAQVGTPIIASAKDALRERVIHDKTGLLIEGSIEHPYTHERFVAATIRLLRDPQTRQAMSHEALLLAEKTHPEQVVVQWENLINISKKM